ncbi:Uncharacterised protein [Mycobacteroides abscessus]|nr:Uncharacterised protein [Mycobacteroides abscessus]
MACTCTCGCVEFPELPHRPSSSPAATRRPGSTATDPARRCARTTYVPAGSRASTTWLPASAAAPPRARAACVSA